MFVIANTIKVKKGFGDKLSARFGQVGHIDKVPGFLDLNLLQTRVTEDDCDEIVVWSKWISHKKLIMSG